MKRLILLVFLAASPNLLAQDDVLLKAMRDELTRSMTLKLLNLEQPYYIDYTLDDGRQFNVVATLGGLISSSEVRFRLPRVQVRVGSYQFDNTNYVASGFTFGSRYDIKLPYEDNYGILRRDLWLATDQAYKSALEAISRKRAALKNVSVIDQIPDFAPSPAVSQVIEPVNRPGQTLPPWVERTRTLSQIFSGYAKLKMSSVEFSSVAGMHYFVSSEGAQVRQYADLSTIRLRAFAQASDGMTLRDAVTFQAHGLDRLPGDTEMRRRAEEVARNVTALAQAPSGETYSGPVLFEGVAAAQIFGEVLGKNFALSRKPVLEPRFPAAIPVSELEGRQGARILPESFDVTDDPTVTEWHGHTLFGSYKVDDEGVTPAPLTLVEKGVLKNFVLTRQPIRGFSTSNGRARLPGNFGAKSAAVSNLFVRSSETVTPAELRTKMMDICRQRNKTYGIVVRKMDFPSSASVEEARKILSGAGQGSGGRPVSLPILVYRVYADGREELIRGVRFRGLNARSFKDIIAAGDDTNIFDFLENGAPFALIGAATEAAETTVVAPSILIDDLEVLKIEDEQPKLPIVPAPLISSVAAGQ